MLSAQDATFIYLESDHSPMHIGGVYLIDARDAPAGFGYEAFCRHIQSRLPCSRIFRQRLVEAPLSLSHPSGSTTRISGCSVICPGSNCRLRAAAPNS